MVQYIIVILLLLTQSKVAIAADPLEDNLQSGFVNMAKIDPSIIINMKYCSEENFTGRPVLGYKEPRALLTAEAAAALSAVQEELVMHGYTLVIYDAYHPLRTYNELMEWAEDSNNSQKDNYFPHLSKQEIIDKGYILNKRNHARGSTVDVSIISLNKKIKTPFNKQKRSYKNHQDIIFLDDGTVDMGSSYDLQDEISSHDNQIIHLEAKNNRKMLREIMENYGYIANDKVWWQYTLKREPYPDSEFDFEV